MPRILFVSGFHPSTRARDLAFEFERYGALVRCDVPAPRNPHASHNPYAFVEYRSTRDAEDAYHEMHGRYFEGYRLSIQWAKNPPSSVWRYERRTPPPTTSYRSRRSSRSRSPRRADRDREREREREREGGRDREKDRERRRSRSPVRDRDRERRSRSPIPDTRRRDDRDRDRVDRARTPPRAEEMSMNGKGDGGKDRDIRDRDRDRDRAVTPPYDR